MKGYYLVYDTFNLENPDGVEKKIISQRDMFCKNGIDIEFLRLCKTNGTFWNNPDAIRDVDFIYFRRGTIADYRFLQFLKQLKMNNPKIIIFMEIPTFPYEDEYDNSLKSFILLKIDHFYRQKLYRYIDRLVIVNNHSEKIWGINVLNLINGVDVGSFSPRKTRESDGIIKICCVAKFSPWHGYERIIRGMSDYYKTNHKIEVKLIMVGTGVETNNYKQLVESLKLEKYVDFRGQLTGLALDSIYDECDIGCCSLGRYKSGIEMTSELKSREFMAKGMPMICGCKIDVLEGKEYPYAIFFPNDGSDIDIEMVVDRYNNMIGEKNIIEVVDDIRRFAQEYIDINSTFQPIVDEAIRLCGKLQ